MTRTVRWLFAVCLIPGVTAPAHAQQKIPMRSRAEAGAVSRALSGRSGPQNVNWIEGGRRLSFVVRGDSGEQIRALDPASGADTLIFTGRGLTFPGTTEPFAYSSFEWARDSKHLLFQTRFRPLYRNSGTADYYVFTLADRTLELAASGARTAELSPDGRALGYERDGDMYVYDLAERRETRLTSDATALVYNGHFDWVYEEEFGFAQAWDWSPDSRHIAFWQVNESAEPVIQLSDFSGRHPTWEQLRIPQPGDSNATVRIGVVDVQSGSRVWLDPGESGEYYVPRIYWTSRPDTLAVVTLNRAQNVMKLWFFDVTSGGKRLVLSDTSRTWIDVYDFFSGVQDLMTFPEGLPEFFWISDRDGWQHIYRFDYSGRPLGQVTRGDWSVIRIAGVEPRERTIYYVSTEASPLERQLYAVRFDGTGQRRLTAEEGTHSIDMSPDTRYYIDRWSNVHQPRQVELWATALKGRMLKKLEDNAAVTAWLGTHAYSPVELFSFTASDGQRLDGSILKPPAFDPAHRYPVIFTVYGGPGSQGVYDAFGTGGLSQWYAQEGYLVVNVNNRGSGNYGSAFMKVVYEHLGQWESHDFAEAARYLARQPWVDSAHIAIMGTSYGGYSTLYTMVSYPEIFSVGIANSPPTDWRLYDSIYTERYMALLGDNLAGYDSSSVLLKVNRLLKGRQHLLLIHSMMDDNVHPQNTLQLLTALTNAGFDADLRIYPPGRHGAAYNGQSAMLIQQAEDEYLNRWMH
jgi:dipeptidyl-peptidase-4